MTTLPTEAPGLVIWQLRFPLQYPNTQVEFKEFMEGQRRHVEIMDDEIAEAEGEGRTSE